MGSSKNRPSQSTVSCGCRKCALLKASMKGRQISGSIPSRVVQPGQNKPPSFQTPVSCPSPGCPPSFIPPRGAKAPLLAKRKRNADVALDTALGLPSKLLRRPDSIGPGLSKLSGLADHLQQAGRRQYCCQQCSRGFSRSDTLKRHQITHSKVKPFQCKWCNQRFSRSDSLKRHQRLHQPYDLLWVDRESKEFEEVARLYGSSLDHRSIKAVHKVVQEDLWLAFCHKKEQYRHRQGIGHRLPHLETVFNLDTDLNEKMLFHATAATNIHGICSTNFDPTKAGTVNGAIHGKGTYFAKNACRSNWFAQRQYAAGTSRFMFLSRVVVGEYTKGDKTYSSPPEVEGACIPRRYDSCVDNESDPKEYVIFDKSQIYPAYLIEYSDPLVQ